MLTMQSALWLDERYYKYATCDVLSIFCRALSGGSAVVA